MRAVFKCDKSYYQISKMDVMGTEPVYSQEETYYSESGTPDRHRREIVGTKVTPGKKYSYLDIWIFAEGEKHNRLTLTDPEEIEAFRDFIKTRDYITEIEEGSGDDGSI